MFAGWEAAWFSTLAAASGKKLACPMRPHVLVSPREPFDNSKPCRAPRAPAPGPGITLVVPTDPTHAPADGFALDARGSLLGGDRAPIVVAAHVRLRGTGVPGQRGLHGSGQLGDGSGGRRALWVQAAVGAGAVECAGDPAADAERAAGHRHRAGPGTGLPRVLPEGGQLRVVGAVRDRHRRLRPGGGAGRGDRHQTTFRIAAAGGRAAVGGRRAAGAVDGTLRHARGGIVDPRLHHHHRRMLPAGTDLRQAEPAPGGAGRDPVARRQQPVRRGGHTGRDGDAA